MNNHRGFFGQLTKCMIACLCAYSLIGAQGTGQKGGNAAALMESIAKACGAEALAEASEIDFIYHSKSPSEKIERSWQWFPRTDDIIYTGKDLQGVKSTIEYSRAKLAALHEDFRTIDAWFIHDRYWLLFPAYLGKDSSATYAVKGSAVMPISGKWASALVAEYSLKEPGRPGDKFEFYIDSTNTIREWVCISGGTRTQVANKWEDYKKVGPMTLSLNRPAADSKGTRVWFTKVNIVRGPR